MDAPNIIWSFLIASLLGFLIGLERERKRETHGSIFAGVTTYPLIALFGTISAHLAQHTHLIVIAVSLAVLGALLVTAYWRASLGEKVGGTSQVAALVTFSLGVTAGLGQFVVALAGAVIATGVLSLKLELRGLAGGLSREDLFALVQFAAVSLVILPLVPDAAFGPWEVWNPRTIWLLVVLISGVSFIGYILSKLVGTQKSISLSGLIGGLASSTAVTLSFSGKSKALPALSSTYAAGILVATGVSMLRLLVLLAVVQGDLAAASLLPFGIYGLVCGAGGWLVYRWGRQVTNSAAELSNPFELRPALTFALLFALVLLVTRTAQAVWGDEGIFLASALAGISQLDAITLALARQVGEGLGLIVAVKGLALALVGNSIFKTVLTLSLGSPALGRIAGGVLILAAALSLMSVWLGPESWLTLASWQNL